MKMFSFVALLATSVAFLSCSTNDDGVEINNGPGPTKCKIAAKGFEKSFEKFDGYKGLDELDPSCASEEKNFVLIYDTNAVNPPSDWDKPEDYDSCIGLPSKEADACVKSIKDKKYEYLEQWRNEHKKRDLPIPCVALGEGINSWAAWLTDDEIAELVETYGVSYDDGNRELINDDLGGGNGNPPPLTDGCGK